jgi:hypothetical protein
VSASGIISCVDEVFVAEELSLSRSPDAPHMWEKFRLAHQKKAFITFYYNVFDVAQGLCGGPKPTGQV